VLTFRELRFLIVPQHYVAINPTYPIKMSAALPSDPSTELTPPRNPPEPQRARRSLRAPQACQHATSNTHRMPSHPLRCSEEVHTRNYRTQTNLVPTWTHPNKKNTSLSRREAVIGHRPPLPSQSHLTQSHFLTLNKKKLELNDFVYINTCHHT
jgi:hypothetical protein